MRNECLIDRLEVVLNNNLIDIKDKITDNRTILGCRLSYADLSKDVSFIVRQDNEPTYEQLQQENEKLKDNWDKLKEWLKEYEEGTYGLGSYETGLSDGLGDVIKKMRELQGSDNK